MKDEISELVVFFLTDGGDGNQGQTKLVADELKAVLKKKGIESKFCVMGLGAGASIEALKTYNSIGTTAGFFD